MHLKTWICVCFAVAFVQGSRASPDQRQDQEKRVECPDGFVKFVDLPSSCYAFVDNDLPEFHWYDGVAACSAMGARVISFESQTEWETVLRYYKNNIYDASNRDFWIGAHDLQSNHTWRWTGTNAELGFENWADGYPIKFRSYKCVSTARGNGFRWNNFFCSGNGVNNVICEK